MALLYCGIDEAGYGPMLGPLCVGMTSWRVDDWTEGDPAPDIWERVSTHLARTVRGSRRRIVVADSKKLKRSGTTKPLLHLERGVLTCLHGVLGGPTTDEALFTALGFEVESHPWYQGEAALPTDHDATAIELDANAIGLAWRRAGVAPVEARCVSVCEDAFNDLLDRFGTKIACTAHALGGLLRQAMSHDGDIRIVCDAQGGRHAYQEVLQAALPGREVRVLEESDRWSRYRVDSNAVITFMSEAEEAHLPVAMASMVAKYCRELMMRRFNTYWGTRVECRPTAGYVQDARRWLEDVGPVLTDVERRTMIRRM